MENDKYPVELIAPRQENYSRGLALATILFGFIKAVLLIPHIVVLYVLGIVLILVGIIAQLIVLITGEYPEGMFRIVKGILQWQVRTSSYFLGLTDKYPPFSLD